MIGLSAIPLTAISKSFCSGSRCKKLAVIYLLKSGSISIGANLTRKLSSHPGATYPFFGKILYGPAFKIPISLETLWLSDCEPLPFIQCKTTVSPLLTPSTSSAIATTSPIASWPSRCGRYGSGPFFPAISPRCEPQIDEK